MLSISWDLAQVRSPASYKVQYQSIACGPTIWGIPDSHMDQLQSITFCTTQVQNYSWRPLPTKEPSQQTCLTVEHSQWPTWTWSPACSSSQIQDTVRVSTRMPSTVWVLIQLWSPAWGSAWAQTPTSGTNQSGITDWDFTQLETIVEPSLQPCQNDSPNSGTTLPGNRASNFAQPETIESQVNGPT